MDTLPPKNFNLRVIVDIDPERKLDDLSELPDYGKSRLPKAGPQEGFCGSTACAIGYCPVVFPKNAKYALNSGDVWSVVNKKVPSLDDFCFAEDFFGLIGDYHVNFLFDPSYYPEDHRGPKSVAKRIRYYVDKDGDVVVPNRWLSSPNERGIYRGLKQTA